MALGFQSGAFQSPGFQQNSGVVSFIVLGGRMGSIYSTKYTVAAAVTPHNTNRADYDAFSVATSGIVKVDTEGATAVQIYALAGIIYPLQVRRIYSTDTAATGIVGYR